MLHSQARHTMAPDTWFNPEYNNKEPSWDSQATDTHTIMWFNPEYEEEEDPCLALGVVLTTLSKWAQ